ncbi:hypothetical protein Pla123a_26700 [Posidoniimonas polymericola]|uniref:Uncharacterized protein n=1 Tax=Posidoniimonas polymericola TaxID=2528002 RepID=A0A5C5YM09_9BACT|nr:hypothetical protein [Posidoniimonas polymericola]TWT75886.1 hypothetical protein Pla123a_26700 [Posidoniimonas polymericola]
MGNKVFGLTVFLLWTASMSWLTMSKIMPAYLHGDAPAKSLTAAALPVAWDIELSGNSCGLAITQTVDGVDRVKEVHSRVMLDNVSLEAVAPQWMRTLVNGMGAVRLDMRNKSTLDSFGNLARITSRVKLNDMPAVVRVDGHVAEGKLKLRIRSGEISRLLEYPWQSGDLLGELAPEPHMIQAYVGRSWRSEVYSPFGSPTDPVELVEARVVEEQEMYFNDKVTTVRRVEYRTVSAAGVSSKNRLRSVVWVAEDGRVLRQDVYFLNTRLRFARLSDEESAQMADAHLELDRYAAVTQPESSPEHDLGD